jgi:hypothetical protein
MTTNKIGIGLLLAAYALLLYISLSAPFYAGAHSHHDPAMLAQYGSPWPVALASVVAIIGIVLTLVPLRRGERWALWTQLAVWAVLFITRISTDPRCLVVLDPHQHGCHSFMIATVLGVIGLLMTWRR